MDLLSITTDDLRLLPIRGVAAICWRAAIRIQPLANSDCQSTLALAGKVLQGLEAGVKLYEPAECLYQSAARAAAEARATKREGLGRRAIASTVIHSAVDCIADLDYDQQAAVTNSMLALRSCGKLRDADVTREITRDLSLLKSKIGDTTSEVGSLQMLGPLWSDKLPDWCDAQSAKML